MSQIKKGAIISYITVIFNIISGLFFTPYLINKVGSGIYGIYTLVITFLNYFLIDFGLGNSVSRFLSNYRARGEEKKAGQFISVIIKMFLILAFIIGSILIVFFFFLDRFFNGLTLEELMILKKMYIISGTSSVILFIFIPLDGILISYELFVELKMCEFMRKVFIIVLSILALWVNSNVVMVVVVNAIVGFIIVSAKLFFVKIRTNLKIEWGYFNISMVKEVGTFSVWMTLIMLAQRFIIPIAPTILAHFSNSVEISIFAIATTVEGYVYTIASCLNGLFLPKLTQLKVEGKNKEINALFKRVGRLQVYIIGLVIMVFIIFGQEFIIVWVGEEFLKAYLIILLIVSPGIVIYAQEVANTILIIEQKLKYKAICYILGAIVSTVISCLLANDLGGIGTGIGIAVCLWGCHVIIMNIVYIKITSLDIKSFFVTCYGKVLPIMSLITIVCFFINKLFYTKSIIFLGLKIIIFIVIMLGFLWKLVMNDTEKLQIKDLCKSFLGASCII